MITFLHLLWGTVIHRPYVYVFFVVYLAFSLPGRGLARTAAFTMMAYLVAFAAEYSATHNGFPFGRYVYLDAPRRYELWIANVPFWDSLSFVFLAYFSGSVARALSPRWVAARGATLMMLLDVVIDPVTVQGDRWFLGRIYYYPEPGFYFGVTAANFAGWWLVGLVTLILGDWVCGAHDSAGGDDTTALRAWAAAGVYAGIFAFNLGVTLLIRDYVLATASGAVTLVTLGYVAVGLRRRFAKPDAKGASLCPS